MTPGTHASGRAQIGLWVSLFLAPHLEQTRCFATSGTGMRLGRCRISATQPVLPLLQVRQTLYGLSQHLPRPKQHHLLPIVFVRVECLPDFPFCLPSGRIIPSEAVHVMPVLLAESFVECC